jgi:hypothetical protein
VIGGELSKLDATEFKDIDKVELVGVSELGASNSGRLSALKAMT